MNEPVSAVAGVASVEAKIHQIQQAVSNGAGLSALENEMVELETIAEKAVAESGMTSDAKTSLIGRLEEIANIGDQLVTLGTNLTQKSEATKKKIFKI